MEAGWHLYFPLHLALFWLLLYHKITTVASTVPYHFFGIKSLHQMENITLGMWQILDRGEAVLYVLFVRLDSVTTSQSLGKDLPFLPRLLCVNLLLYL